MTIVELIEHFQRILRESSGKRREVIDDLLISSVKLYNESDNSYYQISVERLSGFEN